MASRPNDVPSVERLTVIRVHHCIGEGVPGDPARVVTDYYYDDGAFIVRDDPCKTEKPE